MQQQKPLEGAQLVIMTIALSLATFMQVLDSTIANVAIPTIAGNLGSSLSQGTWVITSFGVANAISIPLTGWLAKRVGEVKLFLWSTIAFAIASWAFGLTDEVFAAATAKLVRNNRRWSENWMIGIAFSSWSSWVFGTVIGAFSGSGLLQGYPAVEAALGFMLPALFMSFLLASFQRKQSLCVTAALVGALAGVTLFSIPVAILAGIVCGCLTALIQAFWQGAPDEL